MICAWIETSSAETGSSRHDEVGVQRQRPREPDPLALPARELVRIAAGGVARQPDDLQQLAARRPAARRPGQPVHAQRLADDPPDAVARVERGERVLEDHLHPPPQRSHPLGAEVADVLAVEDDPAGRGLVQAQQRPAERGLAAARLAHQPERLAAPDIERDAVHRLDVADVAVEHDAALDREVDLEVLDLDQIALVFLLRAHPIAALRLFSHSFTGTGLKQRRSGPARSLPAPAPPAAALDLVAAARLERAGRGEAEHVAAGPPRSGAAAPSAPRRAGAHSAAGRACRDAAAGERSARRCHVPRTCRRTSRRCPCTSPRPRPGRA